MNLFTPSYYSAFRCLASACPDTCCTEWDVDVDPEAARRYRSLPGPLGDRLRAVLSQGEYGTVMTQQNGRCPMLRFDGLCELQCQLGEESLCQVCREFPRLRHDYGDFVELGLELSCPEAARLLLTGPAWHFTREALPGGEAPDYAPEAMASLLRTREALLAFLAREALPMGESLAVMLLYGYAVQNELDGGEPARLDPARDLETARHLARPGDLTDIFTLYQALEILTPAWRARLAAPVGKTDWDLALRPLARYFVERYWLQAVSDWDLACRAKFIVLSCLVVKSLGGNIVATAQLYSKEIENDPDNLDALLDAAYTDPRLADTRLLGFLLTK